MLAGKWINRTRYGSKDLQSGKAKLIFRADPNYIFDTVSYLTNFEIPKYCQNKPRFNGVYSRVNLPNTSKDGIYVINLDKYCDIGTHWNVLSALNNNVTYFDSFGVEHISKEM